MGSARERPCRRLGIAPAPQKVNEHVTTGLQVIAAALFWGGGREEERGDQARASLGHRAGQRAAAAGAAVAASTVVRPRRVSPAHLCPGVC